MHEITYKVAMEVAGHEALVRQAYKDSEGVWTWSIGLTSATGHMVERYIGKPQSIEHCLRVYVWALDNYADEVREVFKGVPLTEEQFAAALSFHWNTGAIGRASWVKSFKAGKLAQAKRQFMQWRKPAAIIPRREKERDLFFDGKWSQSGFVLEYTRVRPNGTPDWGSAKRVNIEVPLAAAIAGEIPDSDKVIVEKEVEVPVEVPKPVVPNEIDQKVQRTTKSWGIGTGTFGLAAASASAISGLDWRVVAVIGVASMVGVALLVLVGARIAYTIKEIRKAWEQ